MNEKKLAATAAVASASGMPIECAAPISAWSMRGSRKRSSRYLTPYWIEKSTPRPTNSTMNATEIMFSEPTIARPSAAVTTRPTNSVTSTEPIIRFERSASHRITSTASSVKTPLSAAPSSTDANSSSASGCSPVRRTTAP